MNFNVGDRVRIVNTNDSFSGEVGTVTSVESSFWSKVCYLVKLDRLISHSGHFTDIFVDEAYTLELLYPLQQLSIDLLKEDDHAGQTYNPYNDTWSWL